MWFGEELVDFNQEKYTQGFGDGYKKGFDHADTMGKQALAEVMAGTPADLNQDDPWIVDMDDVLTADKGILYLNGKIIDEATVKQLKAEARTLKNFRIWGILQETLRQKAIEKSVLHSQNFEQTLSGKLMVHSLGVFRSIVNVLEKHGDK